jgi:hypothetical protein
MNNVISVLLVVVVVGGFGYFLYTKIKAKKTVIGSPIPGAGGGKPKDNGHVNLP